MKLLALEVKPAATLDMLTIRNITLEKSRHGTRQVRAMSSSLAVSNGTDIIMPMAIMRVV